MNGETAKHPPEKLHAPFAQKSYFYFIYLFTLLHKACRINIFHAKYKQFTTYPKPLLSQAWKCKVRTEACPSSVLTTSTWSRGLRSPPDAMQPPLPPQPLPPSSPELPAECCVAAKGSGRDGEIEQQPLRAAAEPEQITTDLLWLSDSFAALPLGVPNLICKRCKLTAALLQEAPWETAHTEPAALRCAVLCWGGCCLSSPVPLPCPLPPSNPGSSWSLDQHLPCDAFYQSPNTWSAIGSACPKVFKSQKLQVVLIKATTSFLKGCTEPCSYKCLPLIQGRVVGK